jgi:lysozyme
MLSFDEGRVLHVYPDTKKILTCGVGHNLVANPCRDILKRVMVNKSPITEAECDALYAFDLAWVTKGLHSKVPGFDQMPNSYQAVLINMCFNMGLAGVLKFKDTLAAMKAGNTKLVIAEIKDSVLARELPERVGRLISVLNGVVPKEYL